MTLCSIVWCDSRKSHNCKKVNLHRFPKSSDLRRRWIEAVGEENLIKNVKVWYLCSRHFDETSFNRTLNIVRLRDGTVPSIIRKVLSKKPQNKERETPAKTASLKKKVECSPTSDKHQREDIKTTLSNMSSLKNMIECIPTSDKTKENVNLSISHAENTVTSTSDNLMLLLVDDQNEQKKMVKMLSDKCLNQKLRMKCLHESVRRRDLKIAKLNYLIETLKEKQKFNEMHIALLEECPWP